VPRTGTFDPMSLCPVSQPDGTIASGPSVAGQSVLHDGEHLPRSCFPSRGMASDVSAIGWSVHGEGELTADLTACRQAQKASVRRDTLTPHRSEDLQAAEWQF